MKVIVAGLSKTGTKTMNAALSELGFDVYDYLEHFMFHYEEWIKILKGEGNEDVFRKMYENVDAVVDNPPCYFWKEIHEAFPDAKIILTTRDEEAWFKSLLTQVNLLNELLSTPSRIFLNKFLPLFRKFIYYRKQLIHRLGLERMKMGLFKEQLKVDKELALEKFREHNARVLKEAPPGKLLVYNVSEGWEPLCHFLGKEIPNKPFPHKNMNGKDVMAPSRDHEFIVQVFKQMWILAIVLIAAALTTLYILKDYPFSFSFSAFLGGLLFLFFIL